MSHEEVPPAHTPDVGFHFVHVIFVIALWAGYL